LFLLAVFSGLKSGVIKNRSDGPEDRV
jgi:hypothetical protein